MAQHKEQRVGVFVDVQNMYYSAKHLYKAKVNFGAILKEAVQTRQLIRAIAYVIKADVGEEKNFFEALSKIGYEVKAKDLQIFYGGAKKGDWDIGIAMDIMRMAAKLDVIVLVSGDGDFQDLLEHASALGCRTEVIAFGRAASSKLKDEADLFVDMDKNSKKYLIGRGLSRAPSRGPSKGPSK
ncbi:NYN domain-containing protein [candidate division KSB1 bacterium]